MGVLLREVREEEVLFQKRKERKALREQAAKQEESVEELNNDVKEEGFTKVESIGGVKFY